MFYVFLADCLLSYNIQKKIARFRCTVAATAHDHDKQHSKENSKWTRCSHSRAQQPHKAKQHSKENSKSMQASQPSRIVCGRAQHSKENSKLWQRSARPSWAWSHPSQHSKENSKVGVRVGWRWRVAVRVYNIQKKIARRGRSTRHTSCSQCMDNIQKKIARQAGMDLPSQVSCTWEQHSKENSKSHTGTAFIVYLDTMSPQHSKENSKPNRAREACSLIIASSSRQHSKENSKAQRPRWRRDKRVKNNIQKKIASTTGR